MLKAILNSLVWWPLSTRLLNTGQIGDPGHLPNNRFSKIIQTISNSWHTVSLLKSVSLPWQLFPGG
jgi:hypothetical protein